MTVAGPDAEHPRSRDTSVAPLNARPSMHISQVFIVDLSFPRRSSRYAPHESTSFRIYPGQLYYRRFDLLRRKSRNERSLVGRLRFSSLGFIPDEMLKPIRISRAIAR